MPKASNKKIEHYMKNEDKYRLKLEDIGKENIFGTPEGYFDNLPLEIQGRLSEHVTVRPVPMWQMALKYAAAIIVVMISFWFWIDAPIDKSPEALIASVGEAAIIEYLQFSDLSTSDILARIEDNRFTIRWDGEDLLDHLQIGEDGIFDLFEEYGIDRLAI
jgi:hypothetical protein